MALSPLKRAEADLRAFALSYPGAWEDFPWGESAFKVGKKVFVFMHRPSADLHVTVKLPLSGLVALSLPFASPTGYGLGRSSWVTAHFAGRKRPPVDLLKRWIDESYRAIAPKKVVARLGVFPAGAGAGNAR